MTANQPEPDPFSREGSGPGEGLGSETNPFSTWADGSTPLGEPAPPPSSADQRPGVVQDHSATPPTAPTPLAPSDGPAGFPVYPWPNGSGYANPAPSDEAYAALRGYQASTYSYPPQGVQPYPGYPNQPYYPQPGPYFGYPYNAFRPLAPKSPYAVPSLVLGIVGMFCWITAPVGLGLGLAAIRQIDAAPRRYRGRGQAIGGIVTGLIGTLLMLLLILGAVS